MTELIKCIIKPGAIYEMNLLVKELFGRFPQALVVCDHNSFKALGDKAAGLYQGKSSCAILGQENSILMPTEKTVGEAFLKTPENIELFLACGSGVINDVTRYLAFKTKRPYISLATACSMDGYASSICPLIMNSLKHSYPARPALAILGDTEVLVKSPENMTAAGFGDILGKIIAKSDWLLSEKLNNEAVHHKALAMVEKALASSTALVKAQAEKTQTLPVKLNQPEILEALLQGLIDSGLSITIAGHSRPAASAEHGMSHYLGMKSLFGQAPHHLHGQKVALATLIMARFYNFVFSMNFQEFNKLILEGEKISEQSYEGTWQKRLQKAYGPLFEEKFPLWKAHQADENRRKNLKKILYDKWEELQEMVTRIIAPVSELETLYQSAGLPLYSKDLGYSKELLTETLLCSKDFAYNGKFSLLNLLDELKILEKLVTELEKQGAY
ncbi:MAG: iron-containing alcohol dehydrogenase [Spirochaetales bacterium]|nr:iron-containing alcohol dehydrogenase [Spirochaetales bacterium]